MKAFAAASSLTTAILYWKEHLPVCEGEMSKGFKDKHVNAPKAYTPAGTNRAPPLFCMLLVYQRYPIAVYDVHNCNITCTQSIPLVVYSVQKMYMYGVKGTAGNVSVLRSPPAS